MNNRANIMYFIEHLCDCSQREAHPSFIAMIQRDITHIVDAVAPADGSGAANVKVARKVLTSLLSKDVLATDTVAELGARLDARETLGAKDDDDDGGGVGGAEEVEMANGVDAPGVPVGLGSLSARAGGGGGGGGSVGGMGVGSGGGVGLGGTPYGRNGTMKIDKRQAEQRIEEDRERGKRQREMYWAVSGEGEDEFERMWEDTSDIGEDDLMLAREERDERIEIALAA